MWEADCSESENKAEDSYCFRQEREITLDSNCKTIQWKWLFEMDQVFFLSTSNSVKQSGGNWVLDQYINILLYYSQLKDSSNVFRNMCLTYDNPVIITHPTSADNTSLQSTMKTFQRLEQIICLDFLKWEEQKHCSKETLKYESFLKY